MRCAKCRNEAVFFQSYSGRYLCSRHLVQDIEARAKRTIRSHHWMRPHDHIAVVASGDRRSAALLVFLHKLIADRRDIRLSAAAACGGDATAGVTSVMKVAESLGIPCIDMPLPGRTGADTGGNITRIALAISLDDIAEQVLAQFLFGNAGQLMHPSPAGNGPYPVICPFIAIPSDELERYGSIVAAGTGFSPDTFSPVTIPPETTALFRDYYQRHPATRHALLHLAEQLGNGDAAATAVNGAAGRESGDDTPFPPQERPNS